MFRISDTYTVQCGGPSGERGEPSGSICILLMVRPKSRASLLLCGTEAPRDRTLNAISYPELRSRHTNTQKTHRHTLFVKTPVAAPINRHQLELT